MNDTPRTDAARMPLNSHNYKHEVVHIDTCIELERENAALREDAITLCEIIDLADSAAWRNGNTHPDTGGPDEGEILMSNLYSPLREKYLRAAIDAARKETKP